jgi:hypothetical protein
MTDTDEKFFAWLDGELTGPEADEMRARVESDPRLARLAEQHRALAANLRRSFGAVAEEPVPERLLSALRSDRGGEIIDFGVAKPRRAWLRSLPQWAAMAATLIIGIFLGTMVPQRAGGPVTVDRGALYASADLTRALDVQLASAPTAGPVRIGITFRDRNGNFCRSFSDADMSGLACRDGVRWKLRGLFVSGQAQNTEYRMASGMDSNLAALIGSTIDGEPLDAAAERSARQRGWR